MSEIGYRVGDTHPTAPPDDLTDRIRAALDAAAEHDLQARACRKRAGVLLAALKAADRSSAWRELGLDQRSVDLLVEIGCGGVLCGSAH